VKGDKFDEKKPRWSLLPWAEVGDVVDVITHGAVKYEDENWKHVKPLRDRYLSAMMRHIAAWAGGERYEKDTGKSHLAHAICCGLFLMWGEKQKEDK